MPRVGFFNHAALAFSRNAGTETDGQTYFRQGIEKNKLEKAGELMRAPVTKGLKTVCKAMKNPKVITVALTALALLGVTFAFYPVGTFLAAKAVIIFLPKIMPWAVMKASAYALSMLTVLGTGVRALGRFSNRELMDHFYACHDVQLNNEGELEELPDGVMAQALRKPQSASQQRENLGTMPTATG